MASVRQSNNGHKNYVNECMWVTIVATVTTHIPGTFQRNENTFGYCFGRGQCDTYMYDELTTYNFSFHPIERPKVLAIYVMEGGKGRGRVCRETVVASSHNQMHVIIHSREQTPIAKSLCFDDGAVINSSMEVIFQFICSAR